MSTVTFFTIKILFYLNIEPLTQISTALKYIISMHAAVFLTFVQEETLAESIDHRLGQKWMGLLAL